MSLIGQDSDKKFDVFKSNNYPPIHLQGQLNLL